MTESSPKDLILAGEQGEMFISATSTLDSTSAYLFKLLMVVKAPHVKPFSPERKFQVQKYTSVPIGACCSFFQA